MPSSLPRPPQRPAAEGAAQGSAVSAPPRQRMPAAACRPAGLAAELRVALMRITRRLRIEKNTADVSDGQYSVLAVLDRHGPMTPRELAEHESVQPPSMTRTVSALHEAGLVTRSDDPDDRRQVLVDLTDRGCTEVHETRRRRDAWLARRLAELTVDERQVLAQAAQILRRVAGS